MSYDYYHQQNKKTFDSVQLTDPYAESNKNSMINMAPEWLKKRMNNPKVMELMALEEEELIAKVKPNLTLKRLRSSFWREYEMLHRNFGKKACKENGISIYRICVGICTNEYFAEKIANNDLFITWIIRPPVNYEVAMEEALQHGLNRMREILNFPLYKGRYNKDGIPIVDKHSGETVMEPDEKIANLMLKTVAFLDLRIKGAIPQKIQQYTHQQIDRKSVNYNVRPGANDVVTVDTQALDNKLLTIDDLDNKIQKLSQETQELLDNPSVSRKERNFLNEQTQAELDNHAIEISNEQ